MADPRPDADADAPDRIAVATAGHTGDLDVVRRGLVAERADVRATALGALHRLGHADATSLEAGLRDPDPGVRRRALSIVATRPGDQAPSILDLLDDADPVVAETAAWACGERQPPQPGVTARLVAVARGHDEHLVREAAVAALGAVGDPAGLDAVLAALDERATIRRRAVVALAAFDGPAVEAALQAALGDRDRQVRQAAEDLLA